MGPIGVEREADVGVLVLRGERNAYGAPRLARELEALLDEGIGVVVDLSDAVFVDSANLLELLRAKAAASERGVGFVLQMGVETGPYVRRTFEITRLASVFSIALTRDEALHRARAGVAASDLGAEPA